MAPVRDDDALGPTEDLDRPPDGVPHRVIGLVFLATFVLAALVLALLSGHVPKHPGASLLVSVGLPALIVFSLLLAQAWRKPGPHAAR